MFKHAVSTGLSNAKVKQEVKRAFSSNTCCEKDLLERVNQASHSEAERARKMQLKKPVTASVEMTKNDRHIPEVKREKSPNLYEEQLPVLSSSCSEGKGFYTKTQSQKPEEQPSTQLESEKIASTEEHQEILCSLIDLLTRQPVMAFPDFSKPYILHTDASLVGLDCTLPGTGGEN
ncbi:hypothetical protein BSL78_22721 [Apostichopus japonicus]|uniref:Reverse transcriptase/retrotransposon-derived protein RNase H-like domain-containing protein n=1 Tax=Stichopus japonicus TaxID=307972 RepID=A0A2G8JXG8_STIJA|nr:hypothetical protein BSL78_22721 [Apostichopus japonicus]